MKTYTVWPFLGSKVLPGETLLVLECFHRAVPVLLLHRPNQYWPAGYCFGYDVTEIRKAKHLSLRVFKVSDESGCGDAEGVAP